MKTISEAANVMLYVNNTVFKLENHKGKKEMSLSSFTAWRMIIFHIVTRPLYDMHKLNTHATDIESPFILMFQLEKKQEVFL